MALHGGLLFMLNPETYAKDSEHSNQVALFMWASLPEQQQVYPMLKYMFAIPNGGKRDKITASKLKAEGVKPGVPDIMLPVPNSGYSGLFIEMKKPKGVVSAVQEPFHGVLRALGYRVRVCYGWAEAKDAIIRYMSL